jgi:hypothetical protein
MVHGGKLTFPNATVHMSKADVDFFLDRENSEPYNPHMARLDYPIPLIAVSLCVNRLQFYLDSVRSHQRVMRGGCSVRILQQRTGRELKVHEVSAHCLEMQPPETAQLTLSAAVGEGATAEEMNCWRVAFRVPVESMLKVAGKKLMVPGDEVQLLRETAPIGVMLA